VHIFYGWIKNRAGRDGNMKEDEKKPLSWEIADPKVPVIQSGHMENRRQS
jgi:hypothetical protein